MQDTLYERSVAAFGALNGFVFNSPYANNQDVEKQVDLINLCIYGFLILIAVICGLNIFNTVWADIEGKRREIALLRAVAWIPAHWCATCTVGASCMPLVECCPEH